MSDAPVRLAVVGCGAVAELYHLPAVAAVEDVDLTALADPDLDRARRLAETYGGAPVATHLDVISLADAAIVATPNALHMPIAVELARAGLHVLVEKPLARTGDECLAIEQTVAECAVVGAVGHDFRRFPVAAFAHEWLADAPLGAVLSVDVRQSAGGRWPYASAYVYSQSQSGGGALIDFGVHILDLLLWWLGPLTVTAYADDAAGGVETECEATFQTQGGAPVQLSLTRLREMRDTVLVRCERGTVEIGIFEPAVFRVTTPGGRVLEGDVVDPAFRRSPLATVFGRQLQDFVGAVRLGTTPLVPLEQGRRVVALVDDCYAARRHLRRPWDWPEVRVYLET
jgi:predicted dehydrogenase